MNPNAIYSKSGKGVQEASGKTSLLSRPDRAVLSAIDGRATLADVAKKVGKTFDPAFEKLIETLDKGGFIRVVSAGAASAAPAKPASGAKPGATAPMDAASDLDFTASMQAPKGKAAPPPQTPPKATPAPSKQTVTIPPAPPPPTAAEKAKAEKVAKEQQDAFTKAREEAERKAAAERERVKAEAEAKLLAEQETKLRAEAESKAKADAEKKLAAEAEAKVKAAQAAAAKVAAEAKAKAEAEARKAREEAERARKEAEEKARREQEELKRKLEEERKAREEAERKAKEEARRLEEERKKLEEERRRAEEERKREEAERAARRKREEEEERQRAAEREARRKAEEEEEARERAEREARRKAKQEEEAAAEPKPKPKEKEPEAPKSGGSFSDSLLADLDSFTNQEENEAKAKAEAEAKAKAEAERRAREEAERREKEEAERREKEDRAREKERQKEEAAARKAAEERELRDKEEREKRRLEEEEEKRKKEAEEREKKAKKEERLSAQSQGGAPRAEAFSEEEQLRRRRERQLGPSKPSAGKERAAARGGWGKPIAMVLFLLVVVGLGVAHIIPLPVDDYRTAAQDTLGQPVKIGGARLSLLTGMPQLKLSDVTVGETRIAEVRAFPELDAITGPKKRFSRIEIEGIKVNQETLGQALFAKVKGDNFAIERIAVKKIELVGPLSLPKGLEFDASYDAEGMVRSALVRGPEALVAKLARKDDAYEIDMSAATFTIPFAPEITLNKFGLKGSATPRGLAVSEWDGQILSGTMSGTANVRWGDNWVIDGVLTARNIIAAVFAPALLSDGRAEGSGKFSLRGDPAKLASNARIDGNFTITRGVLGTIDLSRAIQTGGKSATGRTQFNEMNGQGVYDRGAVALRNVTISAGQLNAGASADISASGALSGRIVADVKISSQNLRATLNLGGTVKEPQVRN